MNLESYNFHWRKGYSYGFPLKRQYYGNLVKSLKNRRITILTGTRRTGKTTLMKQMIDNLIEDNTPRENIVYYSSDEDQPTIRDILSTYEIKIGKEIAFSKDKYFFFLDEIQKLKDWQNKLKYFYDHYKNLKFIISGSASLFIKKGVRESLAGRIKEFSLGPLTFKEYLIFEEKKEYINKSELFSETLEKEFEKYLLRQYIEIINENETEIKDYVKSILEKVIYIDIPQLVNIENPNILMKIVRIISSNPGMLLDYIKLAETMGNESPISRIRASNYVHYLEDAYIINLGYNYSKSGYVSERKLKKAYLSNPSLSLISDTTINLGKLAEQTFFIMLKSKFFWRNPQQHEVDIIIENNEKPLPIEIKYKNTIANSELRSIRIFMKHFNVSEGIIITKKTEEVINTQEGIIKMIPAWKVGIFGKSILVET